MRVSARSLLILFALAISAGPPIANAYDYTLLREMAGTNSKLTNSMGSCGVMAIGWVRTVFHDFATFDANATSADRRGGIDASILTETEANFEDNGDIRGGGNIQFFRTWAIDHPTVSAADWIVLGGMVALRRCGGPDLTPQFRPGRVDSFTPNYVTLLPSKDMSLEALRAAFRRMNLTQPEYVTLVLGSHSLGGVNRTAGSPGFGVYPPRDFDSTPTMFDNSYFVNAVASETDPNAVQSPYWLPSDRLIGTEPDGIELVRLYAGIASSVEAGDAVFKERYGAAFMKMVDIGHVLGCPLSGDGCAAAEMQDVPIANQIKGIPESWVPVGYQNPSSPSVQSTPTASRSAGASMTGSISEPWVAVRAVVVAFFACLGAVWFS